VKLYVLPPSPRAKKVLALAKHLKLDVETQLIDLGKGHQSSAAYLAMNPNAKMPVLDDDGFILWESNAILAYMASQCPESRMWPSEPKQQASVLRWLSWEAAHWDQESVGAVVYEMLSKRVLRLGPPEQVFIERGKQNFDRFASVLDGSLSGRQWLANDELSIADFAIGVWVPVAELLGLPIRRFEGITAWYNRLMQLPAWYEVHRPGLVEA